MEGDITSAISSAQECLEKEGCSDRAQALYIIGESNIQSGSFTPAREAFWRVYEQYASSLYAAKAFLRIGDSYFLESEYAEAQKIYTQYLQRFPASGELPLCLLRLVYAERKLGNWQRMKDYATELKKRFPLTKETKEAEALMNTETYFTVQVGGFLRRQNALALMRKLQVDKFKPFLVTEDSSGKTIYKVRVGKLPTRQSAENLFRKLISKNYPAQIYP